MINRDVPPPEQKKPAAHAAAVAAVTTVFAAAALPTLISCAATEDANRDFVSTKHTRNIGDSKIKLHIVDVSNDTALGFYCQESTQVRIMANDPLDQVHQGFLEVTLANGRILLLEFMLNRDNNYCFAWPIKEDLAALSVTVGSDPLTLGRAEINSINRNRK